MSKVYMSFRNNQKAIDVPNGLRTVIRKCIAETLRVTDFVGDADVSVTLVDNERIKRINKEFRDKNKVTDVISPQSLQLSAVARQSVIILPPIVATSRATVSHNCPGPNLG